MSEDQQEGLIFSRNIPAPQFTDGGFNQQSHEKKKMSVQRPGNHKPLNALIDSKKKIDFSNEHDVRENSKYFKENMLLSVYDWPKVDSSN